MTGAGGTAQASASAKDRHDGIRVVGARGMIDVGRLVADALPNGRHGVLEGQARAGAGRVLRRMKLTRKTKEV